MPLLLTKFEVAERQLNQAVRLFFENGDPVSIHTLAEAASQVLYDIRGQFGSKSIFRESDLVRDEHKKEWLAHLFKSRNFFKHADKDQSATHEFKDEFNHFSLMETVNMYLTAKRGWTPESIMFLAWFCSTYPNLVKSGTVFSQTAERLRAEFPSSRERQFSLVAQVIRELRSGNRSMEGVSLELGAPIKRDG